MIAYHCTGPEGTRFAGVRLRLVAYVPKHRHPDTRLKCTLQVIPGRRDPLATHPLHEEFLTPLELAVALSESRKQGWTVEFDHALAKRLEQDTLAPKGRYRIRWIPPR